MEPDVAARAENDMEPVPEVLPSLPPARMELDPMAVSLARLSDLVSDFIEASSENTASMQLAIGELQGHASATNQRIEALEQRVAAVAKGQLESGRVGRAAAERICARIRAVATSQYPELPHRAAWHTYRRLIELEVRRAAGVAPRMRWEDVASDRLGGIEVALGIIERRAAAGLP